MHSCQQTQHMIDIFIGHSTGTVAGRTGQLFFLRSGQSNYISAEQSLNWNRQKRGVNQSINAFQKKCLLWKWTFIGWYYNHALSIFLCILLCLSRPLKVLEMGASYTCKRTPFKHDTFQQSVTVLKMLNDTYTFSGYKYLWYQYRYIFFRDQYFLRDSAFPRSEAE